MPICALSDTWLLIFYSNIPARPLKVGGGRIQNGGALSYTCYTTSCRRSLFYPEGSFSLKELLSGRGSLVLAHRSSGGNAGLSSVLDPSDLGP